MFSTLYLFLLLCACTLATCLHGQIQLRSHTGRSSLSTESVESAKPRLELNTEIIKETYCDGPDPNLLSLRLLLRLSFVNIGKQKVILERGSKQVPEIRISRTLEDAIAGRFEARIDYYVITESKRGAKVSTSPPLGSFVILQPEQTYRTIAEVAIQVPRTNSLGSTIRPGQHHLRIGVWTWDQTQDEAKLRRKAWERNGFLWSASVLSNPMVFTVASEPRPEDCRCENASISENQAIKIAIQQMRASNQVAVSQKAVALGSGCEWQVILDAGKKTNNKPSFVFIIDKNNGRILEQLQ